MNDVRIAIRTLRATPVVTLVVILSLALGIGANTAIFSIVNSLRLRALPVERSDRLVLLLSNPLVTPSSPWSNPVWSRSAIAMPICFRRRSRSLGERLVLTSRRPGRRVTILLGIGVLAGTGASVWASRFVETLLYELEPRDPATLISSVALLSAVGTLAGWLPAYRASGIDPAEVLREG